MEDIIIRCANLSDVELIQNLNYKLFELEKKNYDSTLVLDWPLSEEGKKYFEDLINNEYVIIALKGEDVTGYLAGSINEKGAYELI